MFLSKTRMYLRARPDTALEERRPISDRDVQLSTTDNFCRKNGKCCTIKYYVRKIQNPWILDKHEIQYFIVLYFPCFRQKLSVVLNCTSRSEIVRRSSKAVSGLARRVQYVSTYTRMASSILPYKAL